VESRDVSANLLELRGVLDLVGDFLTAEFEQPLLQSDDLDVDFLVIKNCGLLWLSCFQLHALSLVALILL
jgi:hypothetical protein